ncbi:MAG TPA: polymer-forming cytoskeletal protein [Acidiferrobacterales bacterium]|nr:polymer-forming cytoskeletal protein [Acidiferrobacterales bacterium]
MNLPKFFAWRRKQRRRSADQLTVFSSQIGIGTLLQGELNGKGSYHIQGEVVGDGNIEGAVVLAAGAYWKGNVTADYVRIAGKVEGNVAARSKIELAATAVVTGDLSAPVVAMAKGALYEGAISRPRKTQVTRYSERRDPGTSTLPA